MRGLITILLILTMLGATFPAGADMDDLQPEGPEGAPDGGEVDTRSEPDPDSLLEMAPGAFLENRGQLENDDVRFYGRGGAVWFADDGVYLRVEAEPGDDIGGVVLKQEFVGGNAVSPHGGEDLGYPSNFFYGSDPGGWVTGVSTYNEVWYRDVYDDIDVRYYVDGAGLKYDFLVYPGGDVSDIRLAYSGADGVTVTNAETVTVSTAAGDLTDGGLYIYQDLDGGRVRVPGAFVATDGASYGFLVTGAYQLDTPLVVDPVLNYSTFIGGSGWDYGYDMALNASGCAVVVGETWSHVTQNFPTTPGAYDRTFNGVKDAFVSMLNGNGTGLIFSTYLGGNGSDIARAVEVDLWGYVYVAGETASLNFPVSQNTYDSTHNGGKDVFVTRLYPNGSNILTSTFLGGSSDDIANGLAVHPGSPNQVVVTGETQSTNFPVTNMSYDQTHNGRRDAFVSGLYYLTNLLYSTFLGGTMDDVGMDVVLDRYGNPSVTGYTGSNNFPTTPGAISSSNSGGNDAFITKLSNTFSTLMYSTYVGGSGGDGGHGVAIDSQGHIYVAGTTSSWQFPVTQNAFDTTYNGGNSDGFVLKVYPYANYSLAYCTYLGGNNTDTLRDIVLDGNSHAFVTGDTMSWTYPRSQDAFNHTNPWYPHVVVTQLHPNGSAIGFSTLIGGTLPDWGYGIDLDSHDDIYVGGHSQSANFPTTQGAYQTGHAGNMDAIALKIHLNQSGGNGSGNQSNPQGNLSVTSVSIQDNGQTTSLAYARYKAYTIRAMVYDNAGFNDINHVLVRFDPSNANVMLKWNASAGFTEYSDPNDYVRLENTSSIIHYHLNYTIFHFNITFNWTWPSNPYNVTTAFHVAVASNSMGVAWRNGSQVFGVETDLVFAGSLNVYTPSQQRIMSGDWVKTGETLHWGGVKVVYDDNVYNTYPPNGEFDVRLSDDDGDMWWDNSSSGQNVNITSHADPTDDPSDWHHLNVTGPPSYCLPTPKIFRIRVDGTQPTYHNPVPGANQWSSNPNVTCNITIKDLGGSGVDGSTILYRVSFNNGSSWSSFQSAGVNNTAETINVSVVHQFPNGTANLIHWIAKDAVGNGYAHSQFYRVNVDFQGVIFLNPAPSSSQVHKSRNVTCSITIYDTAGVDARSVEYAVRPDGHNSWSQWTGAGLTQNGTSLRPQVVVQFNEGASNYIKWRAEDVHGVGPTESGHYRVRVDSTNVSFLYPFPWADQWIMTHNFTASIYVYDTGSHYVNGSTIEFRTSHNNGSSWSTWKSAGVNHYARGIRVYVRVQFPDGDDNLIQWRASDCAGNGPTSSPAYSLWVDTHGPDYPGHIAPAKIIKKNKVEVTIDITDKLSGVDGSTVEYSVKQAGKKHWKNWKDAKVNQDGNNVTVKIEIKVKRGYNYIKFRSNDVAGNGPTVSDPYLIVPDFSNVSGKHYKKFFKWWHKHHRVPLSYEFGNEGPAYVDAESVSYRTSTDAGDTWSEWESAGVQEDFIQQIVTVELDFPDGQDNRVQWRAADTAGNEPWKSEPLEVWVDTVEVGFAMMFPDNGSVSNSTDITVGVTIEDATSGVDATTVEYSLSADGGSTWGPWTSQGLRSGDAGSIDIEVALRIREGTDYAIRWRAMDVAGNGPTELDARTFSLAPVDGGAGVDIDPPEVSLLSPKDSTITETNGVELSWELLTDDLEGVTYDVYLDTASPPWTLFADDVEGASIVADGLVQGEQYFWTVVPSAGGVEGKCVSGVWTFFVRDGGDGRDVRPTFALGLGPVMDLSVETGQNREVTLSLENKGDAVDNFRLEVEAGGLAGYVMLGGTGDVRIGAGDTGEATLLLTVPVGFQAGDYEVTITAHSLGADGYDEEVRESVTFTVTVVESSYYTVDKEDANDDDGWGPTLTPSREMVVPIGILAGAIAIATLPWWWVAFLFLLAPLMVRLKKDDKQWRDRIFATIVSKPGIHFNAIKEWLGISNGTLIYNLEMLQREERIRTERDGLFKRFYATRTELHMVPIEFMSMEDKICIIARDNPGAAQSEIAFLLDEPKQKINYHVKKMRQSGVLKLEKHRDGHTSVFLSDTPKGAAKREAILGKTLDETAQA